MGERVLDNFELAIVANSKVDRSVLEHHLDTIR